ncbi:hypothetical protein QAD02_016744 [Eretmocerus hayati]|uniref:Uncharacterized protein n=1 Tax=Eretmocerus hayati TaxID=131215 RepID=A0ACC2PBZ6_9HYME|nr:hypothetical protein QAD02_016744 [Eretmocerus hayati]
MEESRLCQVARQGFYVTRLFGMAPYALPKGVGPARRPRQQLLFAYSLVPFFLYMSALAYNRSLFQVLRDYRIDLGTSIANLWPKLIVTGITAIFSETSSMPLVLNNSILLVELAQSIMRYKAVTNVWISISNFDQALDLNVTRRGLNVAELRSPMLDDLKFYLRTILFISFAGWGVVSWTGITFYHDQLLGNLSYMLPYYGTYVAVLQFCGLVLLLGQRFEFLNDSILASTRRGIFMHKDLLNIKKIESEHRKLLETSKTLNSAFSWSLLLHLFSMFFHTVNNTYQFLHFSMKEGIDNLGKGLCAISWIFMFLIEIWAPHFVCEYTSGQVK